MDTHSLIKKLSEFLAPYTANVSSVRCLEHSYAYHSGLNLNKAWAVKMWDSSARIQSGLLTGDLNSLGNFDECLTIRDVELPTGKMSGKYCLPTIKLDSTTATDAMGIMLREVMMEEKDIKIGLGSLLSKGLRWAYCIPDSCSFEHLRVGLTDYLGPEAGVNISVSSTDCHSVDIEYSAVDYIAIVFFSLILLAVILSTGYEFIKEYTNNGGYWNVPTPPSASSVSTPNNEPPPIYLDEAGPSGGTGAGPSRAGQSGGIEAVRETLIREHPRLQRRPESLPGVQHLDPRHRSSSLEYPTLSPISEERSSSLDSTTRLVGDRPSTLGASGSLEAGAQATFPVLTNPPSRASSSTPSSPSQQAENQDDPELVNPAPSPSQQTENQDDPELVNPAPSPSQQAENQDDPELGNPAPVPQNEPQGEQSTGDIPMPPAPPVRSIEMEYDPWAAFSILSNGEKLFAIKQPKRVLPSLYGIKFISICWVLLAQTCLIKESMPAMNYVNIKTYFTQLAAMPIMNATLALDTFMVVTGVLISYHFLNDMHKRGYNRHGYNNIRSTGMTKKFFFTYYVAFFFHRLARLTPALAAMVLFQVSLLRHLGSGPFWDSGTNDLAEVCHDNWWVTLTYLQNYVGGNRICLPQTWYLRVDMQLYTFAPFICFLLMSFNKRRNILVICSTIVVSITACFLINYFLEIPAGFMSGDPAKWPLKNVYDLQATYTRIAPWLVGIGVGYMLYYYRFKGNVQIYIATRVLVGGWILLPIFMFYAIFGVYPFQHPEHKPDALLEALYSSAFHTVWAFGIGWIIMICESQHGGVVQAVLSWKVFQPLGRLSYCIFLVHFPLMSARAFMTRMPIYITKETAMSSFFGDLLYSTTFAVFLALCVEMPFVRLYKIFLMKLKFPVRRTNPPTYRTFGERLPALRDLALSAYRSISATVITRRTERGAGAGADTPAASASGSSQLTSESGQSVASTRVESLAPTEAERSESSKGVAPAAQEGDVLIAIGGAPVV